MKPIVILFGISILFGVYAAQSKANIGNTVITKWQGDKKSAISITFDDGIINQLTVAKPILDKLGLPATFFIITGKVQGAAPGKFIGRPEQEIIDETARVKTNEENFFERGSLIGFTGTTEALDYHSRAGSLFEAGKKEEAYQLLDEGYAKLRKGNLRNTDEIVFHNNPVDTTTWQQYKQYALQGHEIASHTVTHPRLAILDEPNLLYELEQSKADIEKYLGKEYTFSAECPYGTEDERVMAYAHTIYPALRNRMPESYLEEINRSSKANPETSQKEYVQWQRGPVNSVGMAEMKGWVDTCLAHDNMWLVLVFHGVNGIGWEPRTDTELEQYFDYMHDRVSDIWIATFGDVTKYIHERKNSKIKETMEGDTIAVTVSSDLDATTYDVPMTLKTYVPSTWKTAFLHKKWESDQELRLEIYNEAAGSYTLYPYRLGEGELVLTEFGVK
ncbi:MAG: polysaccharide deacetylase family protein [Maribacter sp.]|nr:polysaccharide deacetylase family protein [Maribacter sp.]